MENHEKIILDLCGGTGSWSRYYQLAGYDVRNITLPEYDVLTYRAPENVYGILAAPPLYRVFSAKLQGRSKREKTRRRPKDSNGLLEDYTRMQAALLGPRKPCRILARIHGEAAPYLPTLGIWRPLDKTDRHLGAVLYPGKEVFLVGGCPKQNPPLFKAGAKQTEFCVSAQVFT